MSDSSMKLPAWFWVIAGVALLWNLIGVSAYIADVTMSEEAVANLPEAQQAMRADTPSWLTAVYALAVFAGVLGSIALLLRKAWAAPIFGVSLAAIIVQMGYVLFGMNTIGVLGAAAAIFPAIVVAIGAAELWFARMTKTRGWIS
jgi:hypothetical protein